MLGVVPMQQRLALTGGPFSFSPALRQHLNLVSGPRSRRAGAYCLDAMPDLQFVRTKIIEQTYREVLPSKFRSDEATVMLLAIGLQESRFEHRTQIGGPAHGFWQFERGGGVRGVLEHKETRPYALAACAIRGCIPNAEAVYRRIVDDDLLACAFARLLLYSDPQPLPAVGMEKQGWDLYLRTWRPGKPHARTWAEHYQSAQGAL